MARRTKPKLSSGSATILRRAALGKIVAVDPVDFVEEIVPFLRYPGRRQVLVDLANAKGENGIEWFWRKWKDAFRPETVKDLDELGNDLRRVWMSLESDNPGQASPARILNKWLAWRPTAEQFETLTEWNKRRYEGNRLLGVPEIAYEYVPFFCSPKVDRLMPDPNCLRAMLVQGVFEHWRHFTYCANCDCAAPYFIAKRIDQTVCDAEVCKAERQREHARRWWNEHRAKNVKTGN